MLFNERSSAAHTLAPRPVNVAASWTYDTIGERKREVAARADKSGYLSRKEAGIILVRAGIESVAAPGPGV